MPALEAIIDLDDFLSSFTMHVLQRLNCCVLADQLDRFPREVGFDLPAAYAKIAGHDRVLTPEEFWPLVDEEIWASAPKSEHFWFLEAAADVLGQANVRVVTAPIYFKGATVACLAGKARWVEEHLPAWALKTLFIGKNKERFATPHTVLFDDSESNIRAFRRAGGQTQIVPRPWNRATLTPGVTVNQVLLNWIEEFKYGRV